jgi:hypothetical protein
MANAGTMTAAEIATAGTLANVAAGVVGGIAGGMASQAVGVAIGAQDSFSWKGVALSAIGGGVAPFGTESGAAVLGNAVVRGALGNAASQGIAVVTGLQDKFSWKSVAASAVGAGVGAAVGPALGGAFESAFGRNAGSAFAARLATGLIAGTTAAAMRGGKVAIQQVATDAFGNIIGASLAGAMGQQAPTQGVGPWSDADYRNGMDIHDDIAVESARMAASQRSENWYANSGMPVGESATWMPPSESITSAQRRALNAGAGPLTAAAAEEWVAFDDEPIGPAANGSRAPLSEAQKAANAAMRARVAKTASDFWSGTGGFAPTTPDSQSLTSALKDAGKAVWNLGMDALSLAEMADPFANIRRTGYKSLGIELPSASDFRATYDTPAFGLTVEVLAPLVPVAKLLGAPRSLGGAAFVEGKYVHDLKPLTNLELYGTAATRTPDEALQLLQRVGHDAEELAQYRFVKLSAEEYASRSKRLGFEFDATYGNVPRDISSVRFDGNIASKMADGSSKIPVYVRKEVFESDEALVQILSHEMYEVEALKTLAARPISTKDYLNLVRPDLKNNLHHGAVQEGDWYLQKFRNLMGRKP